MEINLTKEQIEKLLRQAQEAILQAKSDASEAVSGTSLKDKIYEYTDEAQVLLNKLLSKAGVVSSEEINQLDEQLRLAKKNIELARAERSKRRLIVTGVVIVLAFAALWAISKNKNK